MLFALYLITLKKKKKMTKKKITLISVVIIVLIAAYSFYNRNSNEDVSLTVTIKKGEFLSEIVTSGEVLSSSSKQITGPNPTSLRKFNLRDIKIQDLVSEGTTVKKGEYVGRLNPSSINEKILDAQLNLETALSKYTQQQLDTTLSLKQERNGINDLLF